MDIDFRSPFRLTRRHPNYFPLRTARLLRETHEFGSRFIREVRAEFGDPVADRALRKNLIKTVRITGGDVVLLDKAGRKELGLHPDGKLPSEEALLQRVVTARVIRHLHHREDLRFESRRAPHITVLREPDGRRVIVLSKRENYRIASLKRLLNESLILLALKEPTRVYLYARPTRYMEKIATEYDDLLELRDLHPYLQR